MEGNTDMFVCHNALQTAADHDSIDAFVLKNLLEAGASVDIANDNGDTALMLCVQRISSKSSAKLSHLVDYGANIDTFNICFQNCLHLAVLSQNVSAVGIILENREKRRASVVGALGTKKRQRNEEHIWPDPLHFLDEFHETPMATLHRIKKMRQKTRIGIMELLVGAGAVADGDKRPGRRVV